MQNQVCKTSNLLLKFYNVCFAERENITVLVGDCGTEIYVFKKEVRVDSLFIESDNKNNLQIFKKFISSYKGLSIYFLVHNIDAEIYHESLTTRQNPIIASPIKRFIDHTISNNHLVSYNILGVDKKNIETWFVVFSSLPFAETYRNYIAIARDLGIKMGGIYNLPLECSNIVENLLRYTDNTIPQKHLQVFITYSKAFGVIILAKNYHHLIDCKTIEILSEHYVQDIIQKEIKDYIVSLQDYIKQNSLKVTSIMLIPDNMAMDLKLDVIDRVIIINHSKIKFSEASYKSQEQASLGSIIALLFSMNRAYPAHNKQIATIIHSTFVQLSTIFILKACFCALLLIII